MKEKILELVSHYGYAGIFFLLMLGIVGLPVPDETLLAVVGFLARRGDLHLVPALLVGFLGSACGITVSYLIGRWAGRWFVEKFGAFFHLSPVQLARVEGWFERSGKWTLAFAYYLPGLRHLGAVVAGSSKLPARIFALFAYGGALVWSSSFILLGYFLGGNWEKVLDHHPLVIGLAASLVLLGAAAVALVKRARARRNPS